MAKFVVKKDGREEPFDIEKLKQSIRVNALDTVLAETEQKINELVERVSNSVMSSIKQEKISTREIKERILKELDDVDPKVAKIWRKFDQEQGKI